MKRRSNGIGSDRRPRRPGQTLVEFAFILPIFLILLLGVVQVVLIGGSALAVNQAAVACARYAALNQSVDQTQLQAYLKTIASPLINDSNLAAPQLNPAPPRTTGASISVTITYNLARKQFLGSSFFGLRFPSQVTVTQVMPSE